MKRIVTFGGGSGHTQVLQALKDISDIEITAICPSTDSGGSTGILANAYGSSGYLGDLTKCMLALANNDALADALSYRYSDGPIEGHTVRNLLFLALEKTGGLKSALKTMGEIVNINGHRVLPVTEQKTELRARLSIGNEISGETNIDTIAQNPLWNPKVHAIKDVYLAPKVSASSTVLAAVKSADTIIISPGDLYSSIIPTLLPQGITQAVKAGGAKIILFLNIMTKSGETDKYSATDFIEQIEKYLGKKVDVIIANNAPISKKVLLNYSLENKVELAKGARSDRRIIRAPLAITNDKGALVSDPKAIRKVIEKILK